MAANFVAVGVRVPRNIAVFKDTMQWIVGNEELSKSVAYSQAHTELYGPGPVEVNNEALQRLPYTCLVSVSMKRTFQAALERLKSWPNDKIAVLNFASATIPGGGVIKGSTAQEEALCRCSTLYPCLNTPFLQKEFYQFHQERHDTAYTDACIWTPRVSIIKTDTSEPERLSFQNIKSVNVISCAAPNLSALSGGTIEPDRGISEKELLEMHKARAKKICAIAANHGMDVLILGAHGTGAFGNPPQIVARAYKEILPIYSHAFKAVEFAVYCSPGNFKNYEAFEAQFSC